MIRPLVNGKEISFIIDTGASTSIMNKRTADELGIKYKSNKRLRVRGVGTSLGWCVEQIRLSFNGIEVMTSMVVIDSDIPNLLGRKELKLLGFVWSFVGKTKEIEVMVNRKVAYNEKERIDNASTIKSIREEDFNRIMDEKLKHLEESQKFEMLEVFREFEDIWRVPKLGKCNRMEAEFKVEGRPYCTKMRYYNKEQEEEINRQVDELLKANAIRPSKSPWASVPVLIRKKNGKWRMAVDYRIVNKKMIFDSYPIPMIKCILRKIEGKVFVTCIDLHWGFWNVRLKEDSKEYTAFKTAKGLYEWNVIPFGICNSPGEFQRAVDLAIQDISSKVQAYIDDISFGTNSWENHIKWLRRLFSKLRESGFYINLEKVQIAKPEVELLGHLVGKEGKRPDPKKISGLLGAKRPENTKELKSFMGAINFLKDYGEISRTSAALSDLLKKKNKFNWEKKHERAWLNTMEMLKNMTLLNVYDNKLPLCMVTDASNKGIGSCLFQVKDEKLCPLAWMSKKYNEAEKNYDVREKELLSIKASLEYFQDYTKYQHTYIFTDHQSLKWLESCNSGRVMRWSLYLAKFSCTISYIAGQKNPMADWVSRECISEKEDLEIEEFCIPTYTVTGPEEEEVINISDEEVEVENKWWVEWDTKEAVLPSLYDIQEETKRDKPEEGIFTYIGNDNLRYYERSHHLWIPRAIRESILHWFHVSRFGNHRGIKATTKRIKTVCNWPRIERDVTEYLKWCPCSRFKKGNRKTVKNVLAKPFPNEMLSIDWIGDCVYKGEKFNVCVLVDHCTRFMMVKGYAKTNSENSIDLVKKWVDVLGVPKIVLSDRGSEFVNRNFTKYITEELLSYHMKTTPYFPQGNAINETSHHVINVGLKTCMATKEDFDRDTTLSDIVRAYNATPHSAIGCTPHYAVFGNEPIFPGWQELKEYSDMKTNIRNIKKKRHDDIVNRLTDKERAKCIRSSGKSQNFKVGDWIIYQLSDYERRVQSVLSEKAESLKLQPHWSLPVKVVEINDNVLKVNSIGSGNKSTREVSKSCCKILPTRVPESLIPLIKENIQFEVPMKRSRRIHEPELKFKIKRKHNNKYIKGGD